MRVLRVLVGVLLLLVAVPTLLLGVGGWVAMQHRDADGEFRARLATIAQPGFAVVVPDVDALLRRDAPFSRAGRTGLSVTALSDRQLFIGIAKPEDVVNTLGAAGYTRIDGVSLGNGPLELGTTALAGTGRPPALGPAQPIWLRAGNGSLALEPGMWRDRNVALVVLAADGEPLGNVDLVAAVNPYWLNSTTWGLLILAPVLLLLAIAVLAWQTRARPVLYVLETLPQQIRQPQTRPQQPPPVRLPPLIPVDQGKNRHPVSPIRGESQAALGLGGPGFGSSLDQRELGVVARPEERLSWPPDESQRATENAVAAVTEELPLVRVVSPLEIPTAEMPLVAPPVRVRLDRTMRVGLPHGS